MQLQSIHETPNADDWEARLDDVYETMREMSLQTDPQEMVRAYGKRMKRVFPSQRRVSLSRRHLQYPQYRVTRFSEWDEDINPWDEPDKTPVHSGGLFAELIYGDRPKIVNDLHFEDGDPAAEYFEGQQSLLAIPLLDAGHALNMVVLGRDRPNAFDVQQLPEHFWLANLFGRATYTLVLSAELREAYNRVDREMKSVAAIQRSLLPQKSPEIPNLTVATHYETSERAGGDYYDFFPLNDGRWGMLIADVSGHGTPAAVVMAITHAIAHLAPHRPHSCHSSVKPGDLLKFLNNQLSTQYTNGFEAFVTAFYGIFDPKSRKLVYSTAGHNPPRVWRCSKQESDQLADGGNLPLGLMPDLEYPHADTTLLPGDKIVLYTDGIIEATNVAGELFGVRRLDQLLSDSCHASPKEVVSHIINAVGGFTSYAAADDDRTLVVAMVD